MVFGGGSVLMVSAMVGERSAVSASSQNPQSGSEASQYPPPVRSHGGALAFCPEVSGLLAPSPSAEAAALGAAKSYSGAVRARALALSDQAWWPEVRRILERGGSDPWTYVTGRARPLADEPSLAGVVRRSCGEATAAETVAVTGRPATAGSCDACGFAMLFIDRRGRSLLYFVF